MRSISFEDYNKKRRSSKLTLLKVRDNLKRKPSDTLRRRDKDKKILLYKLANKRKESMLKKIGERKYKLLFRKKAEENLKEVKY